MDTTRWLTGWWRPMANEDGPEESPEPAPVPAPEDASRRGRLHDWERIVAVAIGVVTLSAALLTYVAVLQDDASSDARGQATLETLQLQRQELIGRVRVQGEETAADRYRGSLAEAEALDAQAATEADAGHPVVADQLRTQAAAVRYVADGYKDATFDSSRLSAPDATGTYDVAKRLDTIEGYDAFNAIEPDQPAHTVTVADDRHDQSVRTLLCVMLLLLLAVVLTLGRILSARWRGGVLAVSVLGWLVACGGALVNAMAG